MKEKDKKLAFVKASKYREEIVVLLGKSKKTPKELSKICETSLSHVSGLLRGLKDKNVVECLTPDMRKGRLYGLTEEGREIEKEV